MRVNKRKCYNKIIIIILYKIINYSIYSRTFENIRENNKCYK